MQNILSYNITSQEQGTFADIAAISCKFVQEGAGRALDLVFSYLLLLLLLAARKACFCLHLLLLLLLNPEELVSQLLAEYGGAFFEEFNLDEVCYISIFEVGEVDVEGSLVKDHAVGACLFVFDGQEQLDLGLSAEDVKWGLDIYLFFELSVGEAAARVDEEVGQLLDVVTVELLAHRLILFPCGQVGKHIGRKQGQFDENLVVIINQFRCLHFTALPQNVLLYWQLPGVLFDPVLEKTNQICYRCYRLHLGLYYEVFFISYLDDQVGDILEKSSFHVGCIGKEVLGGGMAIK